jgi:hypothetical protein
MSVDLFAGIPVADFAAALTWYEHLLGSPSTFFPTAPKLSGNWYRDPEGNEIGFGGAPD